MSIDKQKKMIQWDGSTAEGLELVVQSTTATEDAAIGCSIAVNGVCLTATELNGDRVG